ncbi:energy transducer TonB [Ferruginibacter profundus]
MKTDLILKSEVLDILFENRNKAYGAYDLRKFYDNRLIKSLGLMIAVVIILSAFTFIPKKKTVEDNQGYIPTMGYVIPPAKDKVKEPEKPKTAPQPKQKAPPTQIWTIPVITTKTDSVKPLAKLSDSVAIASVTGTGKPGDLPVIGTPPGDEPGGGGGDAPVVAKPSTNTNTVLDYAEVMPSYPGGMDALRKFLQRNLTNPRDMEEGELVNVKVRFVVGYDGKLQSFVTVEDGGDEFNKEVVRVLKKMPAWIPGKSNGQNVAVYYTIPVKFVAAN